MKKSKAIIASIIFGSGILQVENSCSKTEGSGQKPGNVLLIVSDDLNWTLGCYGHPVIKTPNIDRLASQGIRFNNAYCQFSVCNPSRASFLTSLYPQKTEVMDNSKNFRDIHPEILTLPQYFRENGYWTGVAGKIFHHGNGDAKSWTWLQPYAEEEQRKAVDGQAWRINEVRFTTGEGRNVSGGRLPWSIWRSVESGLLTDNRIAEIAVDRIRQMPADQPFFLGVGFIRPHDLFFAPKEYFDMYPMESITLPELSNETIPRSAYGILQWKDVYETLSDQDKKELLRAYYASVSFMDAKVGELLEELDRQGLRDNTIILLTSDHGYHNWEKDWWGKCTVWELSARVPLIIASPALKKKNIKCNRIVELIDIFPTLVEMAGLPPAPSLEGRSLVPLLTKPNLSDKKWQGVAFTQFGPDLLSVRTENRRYCLWKRDQMDQMEEALYDHRVDPQESVNLIHKSGYKKDEEKMRKLLLDHYSIRTRE